MCNNWLMHATVFMICTMHQIYLGILIYPRADLHVGLQFCYSGHSQQDNSYNLLTEILLPNNEYEYIYAAAAAAAAAAADEDFDDDDYDNDDDDDDDDDDEEGQ